MTRILLCGCNGKMGQTITRCASSREDCRIVAGIDCDTRALNDYPVFALPEQVNVDVDVVIDFSHPSVLSPLLQFLTARRLPAILCTTGYSPEQIAEVRKASEQIPLFYSGNMSLGINLLIALAKTAATVLGNSFDVEIIEKHHNQKLDAPSGTALMLANAISESLPEKPEYVYDRHAVRQKRTRNEIGIHAVRGGTIVGEHEILFAGEDEVITLAHSAQSKAVFAAGSLNAAVYMAGKTDAGLYDMSDLIRESR